MMIINTIILATITNAFITAFIGLAIASLIGYFIAWLIKKMKVSALKQKLKERQNAITELTGKNEALSANGNNLEMLLAENEKYAKKQKKKAKAFKQNYNLVHDNNSELKKNLEDALDKNFDLTEAVNNYDKKNQNLAHQNQNLSDNCAALQKQADTIPNLKDEINTLQKMADTVPNLQEEISILQKKADTIPNLKDEISILQKEGQKIPDLQNRIDALDKEMNDQKSDIITKDIIIDDLKNKLNQSEEDLSDLRKLIDESNNNALSLNSWLVENE